MSLASNSGGFEHFSGFETASTDLHATNSTAHQSANALKIGFETTLCTVIGMRNAIAELRAFATDFTTFSH
jgi:hypothetical protein